MPLVKTTLLVNLPLEDVYTFLNTPEKHTLFIPNMVEFIPTKAEKTLMVGTKVMGLRVQLGTRIKIPYTITHNVAQKELAMRGKMGFIDFEDGYHLSTTPQGTKIDFWLNFPTSGWMNLLYPFLWVFGVIHAAETIHNLKRALKQ